MRPVFDGKRIRTNPETLKNTGVLRFVLIITYGHTAATMLAEAGVPLKQLQTFLGHDDIEMTLGVYVHAPENAAAETSDKIGKTMGEILFDAKCSDFCSESHKVVKLG